MLVQTTKLKGCVIIEPSVFGDNRGFFLETFSRQRYFEEAGIKLEFVQDNHSRSAANVLRGLHFQKTKPQGKLVRVVRGCVFDVAVDIRPGSDTFLFNALLTYMDQSNALDYSFIHNLSLIHI